MFSSIIRILLAPFAFMLGYGNYANAQKLEKEGKYKEACYQYAVAILNGGILDRRQVKNKIKQIWQQHGPFDYAEDLKNSIEKYGDTPERCAEAGHAVVMSIIKESL